MGTVFATTKRVWLIFISPRGRASYSEMDTHMVYGILVGVAPHHDKQNLNYQIYWWRHCSHMEMDTRMAYGMLVGAAPRRDNSCLGYLVDLLKTEKPHSRGLRKGRVSEPGRIYLITTVTHKRKRIFSDLYCGRILVRSLMQEADNCDTLAYVVMPDHLHWLIQLRENVTLNKIMQRVKSVSAHKINFVNDRTGPVWQDGYHDHALRSEEDLQETARYIVANPLRAGLVKKIGDYPFWDAVWL